MTLAFTAGASLGATLSRIAARLRIFDDAPTRTAVVLLRPGELHRIDNPAGRTIECLMGCIWITHDDEPADVILDARQTHRASTRSRALVQAFELSVVRIV